MGRLSSWDIICCPLPQSMVTQKEGGRREAEPVIPALSTGGGGVEAGSS